MGNFLTGYHGTKEKFDKFTEDMIGSREDNHINSNLGFWFFTSPDSMSAFGDTLLEADIDLGKVYNLEVEQLHKLSMDSNNDKKFFQNMRKDLIEKGFSSIALIERSGKIGMYIVLKEKSIKNIKSYTEDAVITPNF